MTLTRITLTLLMVLAGASLAFAGGGRHHPRPPTHEVWTVDQSICPSRKPEGMNILDFFLSRLHPRLVYLRPLYSPSC